MSRLMTSPSGAKKCGISWQTSAMNLRSTSVGLKIAWAERIALKLTRNASREVLGDGFRAGMRQRGAFDGLEDAANVLANLLDFRDVPTFILKT
jgi:hypothetical protein